MATARTRVYDFVKTHHRFFKVNIEDSLHEADACKSVELAHGKSLCFFSFNYNGYNDACVYLPEVACKKGITLKRAINAVKDIGLTNNFILSPDGEKWRWYPVTTNRLAVLHYLISAFEEAQVEKGVDSLIGANRDKLSTINALQARIKELEAQLVEQKNKDTVTNICDYIQVKQNIAFVDTSNSIGADFEVAITNFNDVDIYQAGNDTCDECNKIDFIIDKCRNTAAVLNDVADNLNRAKAKGATHVVDGKYTAIEDFKF
jgi:hypothetical protein